MMTYTFDPNKLTIEENAKANIVIKKLKNIQNKGLLTTPEILWALSEQLTKEIGRGKACEVYTNIARIFI